MPIFEYRCECGISFETLVMNGNTARCPRCNSEKLEQLISRCSFKMGGASQYRGVGFNPYENLTLEHVRDEKGEKVKVNSVKELREAEKKYNFVHAMSEFDHKNIDTPPTNEAWAGDIRTDYEWKWQHDPEKKKDMEGVTAGPTEKEKLLS